MTVQPARRRAPSGRRFVRDLVVVVVVALLASFLIKTFLIRSFYIPSPSMENTLLGDPGHHDRILVDELVPRIVPLQRGDVIVFRDPDHWLGAEQQETPRPASPIAAALGGALAFAGLADQDTDDHLVKRVIGLPGDDVRCCNALGQMTVNGAPLDEPYVRLPPGFSAVSAQPFSQVVPKDTVWVMGDNRYDSADSRFHRDTPTHGAVPIADVTGRAFVISWPATRWRWLSNYPAVFAGVPAPGR